nr:MAG TPA: hypothetical protein [Caudoviricetes sp.]
MGYQHFYAQVIEAIIFSCTCFARRVPDIITGRNYQARDQFVIIGQISV